MADQQTKQGVRNLNNWGPKKASKPVVLSPGVEILDDLIYDDTKRIREEISGRFPEVTFEASYDDIHEKRLSVRGIRATKLTYYKFLIATGLAELSLVFQVALYQDQALVEQALDEERPRWREQLKRKQQKEQDTQEG